MSNKIHGVFAIIFSKDKKEMVMVKRRDFPLWVFPGGGVEDGETPEEACEREVHEETGLRCKVTRQVTKFHQKALFRIDAALFECEVLDGDLTVTDETKGAAFFPITEPPKPLLPMFKEFLEYTLMASPPSQGLLKTVTLPEGIKFLIRHPNIVIRFLITKLGLHINSK